MPDEIVRSKDGNFNETYHDMGDDTLARVVAASVINPSEIMADVATEATLADVLTAVEGATPAGTNTIGKVEAAPGAPTIITVTTVNAATQFASNAAAMFMVKSRVANTGLSYIGDANDVSASNGFELSPGESSGWVPATNTNLYWHFSTNGTDKLDVWVKA